jgi:hypothetical protein
MSASAELLQGMGKIKTKEAENDSSVLARNGG